VNAPYYRHKSALEQLTRTLERTTRTQQSLLRTLQDQGLWENNTQMTVLWEEVLELASQVTQLTHVLRGLCGQLAADEKEEQPAK
jgi:hypothetical protein